MRKQREVLKHQTDAALLRRHEAVGPGDLVPVDEHAAGAWPLDTGGYPEQRRLAASGGSQQADDLARRHVEADIVERELAVEVARHALEG